MSDETPITTEEKKEEAHPSWLAKQANFFGNAMAGVLGFYADKFVKHMDNSAKTQLVTLDASGNYTLRTLPTTWTVTIQNAGGVLDGVTVTVGDISFTYPQQSVLYDSITLPKPGTSFKISGTAGDNYTISEVPIPNYRMSALDSRGAAGLNYYEYTVKGPFELAPSGTYTFKAKTNGYQYAQIVPNVISGTITMTNTTQYINGILTWVNNGGSSSPPGMSAQNLAVAFGPPINDEVAVLYTNSSSTATATIESISVVLS